MFRLITVLALSLLATGCGTFPLVSQSTHRQALEDNAKHAPPAEGTLDWALTRKVPIHDREQDLRLSQAENDRIRLELQSIEDHGAIEKLNNELSAAVPILRGHGQDIAEVERVQREVRQELERQNAVQAKHGIRTVKIENRVSSNTDGINVNTDAIKQVEERAGQAADLVGKPGVSDAQ